MALSAYRCTDNEYLTLHFFYEREGLSLSRCGHTFRHGDVDMLVFYFTERAHAEKFHDRFGGEFIDPKSCPQVARLNAPVAPTAPLEYQYNHRGRIAPNGAINSDGTPASRALARAYSSSVSPATVSPGRSPYGLRKVFCHQFPSLNNLFGMIPILLKGGPQILRVDLSHVSK